MSTFTPAAVAPAPAPALDPHAAEHNSFFRCIITGMNPGVEGPQTSVTDLNRTDMQELLDHQHLLDPAMRSNLELVRRKPDIYPERFFDANYLPNSTLLVASTYPGSQRYAFCCVPTSLNRKGTCRDHKFCPYCNYVIREQAVKTYVPAFDQGNWHFLTLSFAGQLPFDSANIGATIDCWDACKNTLRSMHASRQVSGVHWIEELAVLSFLPLRVMPHVHALVDADDFGDDQIERMRLHLSNWRNEYGEGVELAPDIDIRPISTARSLLDRTRYIYKPINLARPYDVAWHNHVAGDRSRAWELNSQARELAAGIFEVRKMRNRMDSKGTLNPRAKGFIGVAKNNRINHSQYIRELQQQPAEYPEELRDCDGNADNSAPIDANSSEAAFAV
jgi:hypothetical protein